MGRPRLSPVSRTGLVHGAHAPRSTRHSNVEPAWSAVNCSSTSRVAIHGRGSARDRAPVAAPPRRRAPRRPCPPPPRKRPSARARPAPSRASARSPGSSPGRTPAHRSAPGRAIRTVCSPTASPDSVSGLEQGCAAAPSTEHTNDPVGSDRAHTTRALRDVVFAGGGVDDRRDRDDRRLDREGAPAASLRPRRSGRSAAAAGAPGRVVEADEVLRAAPERLAVDAALGHAFVERGDVHDRAVEPVRGRDVVSRPCEPFPHSAGDQSTLPTASTARMSTACPSPLTGCPDAHGRHSS